MDTDAFDLAALLSATQDIEYHDAAAESKDKMQLLQFLRTLMKMLALENPTLYNQTMLVMEECAIKARNGVTGFENYEAAQRNSLICLQETVGKERYTQAAHRSGHMP